MAWKPGLPELLIILVVVLLLFGPGRIARIAGELGKGIRAFKEGVDAGQETKTEEKHQDETAQK
ncbi:MAG: hypothetical protein Fur0043_16000 [Anaerolineales bacterium]